MKMFFRKWKRPVLFGLLVGCIPVLSMCSKMSGGCSCGNIFKQAPKLERVLPVEIDTLLPKFECAQAPSSANCCIADNPVTAWNENQCCQAYKKIEEERLHPSDPAKTAMGQDESAKTPFSIEEAAQYNEACCHYPDDAKATQCCLSLMTHNGDISDCLQEPPPPPPPAIQPPPPPPQDVVPAMKTALRCYCDDKDNEVTACAQDGTPCCLSFNRNGGPSTFTCELKVVDEAGNDVINPSEALIATQTIEWVQTKGSRVLGIVGGAPGGGPMGGSTSISVINKSLATVPIDNKFHGVVPPANAPKGQSWETYELTALAKTVNAGGLLGLVMPPPAGAVPGAAGGQTIGASFAKINVTNGEAFGGGCGCRMGGESPLPRSLAGGWLLSGLLILPWWILRRLVFSLTS